MYNVHMKLLKFEWDKKKEKANVKKHGISFEDARTAFYDDHALQFFDPDILRMRKGSFCWERIISSRRWLYATASERRKQLYE